MKLIGFTTDELQTVYKILATILHLVLMLFKVLNKHKPLLFSHPNVQEQVNPVKYGAFLLLDIMFVFSS